MIKIISISALTALLEFSAIAQSATNEARKVFEKYIELENAYDPSVADLYSDNALIENSRRFPDGTKRKSTLPALAYKRLIRQALPTVAKNAGDKNRYSEITYTEEDGKVRVKATRFSELKKYSSPLSLLIAQENGRWLIAEEMSESLAQASSGPEPFLKQSKTVPARREWSREIVSKKGGIIRFRVFSPERFGVTLVTGKAYKELAGGVKRKLTKEEIVLTQDSHDPLFEKTVKLAKGGYYFILENQSDKTVEIQLECTEVIE